MRQAAADEVSLGKVEHRQEAHEAFAAEEHPGYFVNRAPLAFEVAHLVPERDEVVELGT